VRSIISEPSPPPSADPEPWSFEPVEGVIVALRSQYVIRLVTGEEVKASLKLPRRIGCIFGSLIGWRVKLVRRRPPKSARIVELLERPAQE
jgi:hypothetical protein